MSLYALQLATELIKLYEKSVLKAYMPTPNDVPTIGYGFTRWKGQPVFMGLSITQKEAEDGLQTELWEFYQQLEKLLGEQAFDNLTDHALAALLSFVYNCGIGNLKICRFYRRLKTNNGIWDADTAREMTTSIVTQKGKRLLGLVRRRASEAALSLGETPSKAYKDAQRIAE